MANTIAAVYVQTFEQIVRHLAQQAEARLRNIVQERSTTGQSHNWETMGQNTATAKTTRAQATPVNDSPWGRRQSLAATINVGDLVEQEDPVQMLVDPNSNIAHSISMAMKRGLDDSIIAAAVGDSRDGDGAAVTFPAGQVIGSAATLFSYDLVTEAYEKFMQSDIDPSVRKCFVVGPTQLRKLQQLTEFTSSDYVNVKALATTGFVKAWMGFDWIVSTRLNAPTPGTDLECFACTERAIGLQMNRDISVRVAEDPSVSFAWRVYAFGTWGAIRVEDEQLVKVWVKDSLT